MKLIEKVLSKIWAYRDIFLLVAVAVLAFLFIYRKPVAIPAIGTNPIVLKPVDSIRDVNNKLYAQIAQQVQEKATAQAYTDSLENALRIAKGSIRTVDKYVTRDSIAYIDTATKAVYITGDTIKSVPVAYSTEFKDSWVDIKAVAGKDTGSISFKDVDTVTRIETTEKSLFGPTKHNIFLGNSNPHNDITEGASFTIKEKVPAVIILPTFQYSPFSTGSKFNVGISIGSPKFAIKF